MQSHQVGISVAFARGYARPVATARDRGRCRERLEGLSESSLDCDSLQRETIVELQGVIGFDRWCWAFSDPDSLVPLGGLAEHDYGPAVARSLELEYSGGDFATMSALARRANPVGSLSAETGGDLARSPRWDEVLRPVAAPTSPGVVLLDDDLRAVGWTAGAREWIDALPLAGLWAAWGILPAVVYPVAALGRSRDGSSDAHALERATDGRWVKIEAARLEGQPDAQIAVTLRAATSTETFDLLCRACALSRRERSVVAALLAGLDTRAVSARLCISRHTVQDHLKSVFKKTGAHSRRELLARFSGASDPASPPPL